MGHFTNPRTLPKVTRTSGALPAGGSQVPADIQTRYENGTPFFSKDQLRCVAEQLAVAIASRERSVVTVKGLDGEVVAFEFQIGHNYNPVTDHFDDEDECEAEVGFKWKTLSVELSYKSPQSMANPFPHGNYTKEAYCSIYVLMEVVRLNEPRKFEPVPSLKMMRDVWACHRQSWKDSESCRRFVDIVSAAKMPETISKVIGFGLGRFADPTLEDRHRSRAVVQHSLLLSLCETFRNIRPASQVNCYAQDPAYNEVDQAVLNEADITVLDNPQGFLEMDDESVVVSFCNNCPFKEIVRDLAKPAAIIWDDTRAWELEVKGLVTDPFGPRVQEWIREHYDEFTLSLEEKHFGNPPATLYVRRELSD